MPGARLTASFQQQTMDTIKITLYFQHIKKNNLQAYHCVSSENTSFKNTDTIGTSLMVQWLRICLLIQGTQVRSLVLELRSHTLWSSEAHTQQLLKPTCSRPCAKQWEKLPQWDVAETQLEGSPRSPQLDKALSVCVSRSIVSDSLWPHGL